VCRDTDANEVYLLKEYIAYNIYHLMTEMSFKSHLVRVTYFDSGNKNKPMTRYAFVLQDEDELAETYGGRMIESASMNTDFLHQEQLALFSFFQYMIGNTDWAFGNAHNVKVFTHPETNTLIPVAYDFDYSGFVNTTYAIPHESIPVKKVTDRFNKCDCVAEEMCEKTRQYLLDKQEEILSYIESVVFLNRKEKKDCAAYIKPFFTTLEDPKQTWRVFVRDCKTR
jgi:hypothetical protein